MKSIKFRLFTILLAMVFVLAAFLPDATALAEDTRGVAVPVTQTPHGTIQDTTPTYKWTMITGATMYQYQVYQGTTKVLDKTPDSGICGATTCEKTPTFTLGYNVYKWHVRAYKTGVWSAWSAYMNFTVSPPGFDNQFNGALGGWARKSGGTWLISSSKYLFTSGLAGKWSAAYKTGKRYSDFDYTARVYRYGTSPTYIAVRMGTSVAADERWYPGYILGYNNGGYYGVYKYNTDGNTTIIQTWTSSAAIVKNGWNTLRVVAEGNQFWFYINGILVKSFADSTFTRGFVGVLAYRHIDATLYNLFIDYATLDVIETVQ